MKLSEISADKRSDLLSKVASIARQAAMKLTRPVTYISADSNPTTNVDAEVSSFLRLALSKLIDIPVLSEEDEVRFSSRTSEKWIVDPVDGTLNFLSGSPDVAISIALVDEPQLVQLAVVFLPFHQQLFSAQRHRGSFLNGVQLKSRGRTRIAAYGIPGNAQANHLDLIPPLQRCIAAGYFLRQSGSAAVDICRVAQGNWCAYFQRRLFIWDVAAADLIATEAGATSRISMHQDGVTCDYIVTGSATEFLEFTNEIRWE